MLIESTLERSIHGPSIACRYCRPNRTNSYIRHVVAGIVCRKFKITRLWCLQWHKLMPNFVKRMVDWFKSRNGRQKGIQKDTHRQHNDLIGPSFIFLKKGMQLKIRVTSKQVVLIKSDFLLLLLLVNLPVFQQLVSEGRKSQDDGLGQLQCPLFLCYRISVEGLRHSSRSLKSFQQFPS